MKMVLVNEDTKAIVKKGDEVVTTDGELWVVEHGVGLPPHKPSSTGKIWVRHAGSEMSREFFPGVFNCKWVEQ